MDLRILKDTIRPLFKPYFKIRFKRNLRQELLSEAKRRANEESKSEEELIEYQKALDKILISYDEYFHQYDFPAITRKEKEKYITRAQVRLFYFDIPKDVKMNFWDKEKFLRTFSRYVHRDWMRIKDHSFEEMVSFMNQNDVICKPLASCCGEGIYKIHKNSLTKEDLRSKYREFIQNDVLLEQAISNGAGMEEPHPESLNTIRVVTVRNVKTGTASVFGAFFRMGRGTSTIDNAHAGGLFAQINVESGILESDGISVDGDHFSEHPDTGFRIKGFQIPKWEEIKKLCLEASNVIPQNYITGWDVVINQNEEIELIEGNHGPDWDVMQSPLKVGVKQKLIQALGKRL
ncbi:MAG: hypothetical protein K2N35_02150 [Muribaculaceae bacterium]|nr:hypothetical protein [Muribaculaceae bacterium]